MYIKYFILKEIPLVRVTLVFIIGLILGLSFPSKIACVLLISFVLLLLTIISVWKFKAKANSIYLLQNPMSFALFLCVLLSAYLLSYASQTNLQQAHYLNYPHLSKERTYQIEIKESIEAKAKSIKIIANVERVFGQNESLNLKGEIVCYLQKDSLSTSLQIKDQLIITTKIDAVASPKNPKELNYKEYLANQSIHGTCYVSSEKWIIKNQSKQQTIIILIANLRNYLGNHIKEHIKGEREQQIALAILIGEKNDLDTETKRIYASSGAMHILAVSGLHVGIVFLLFNSSLFFLNRKQLRWLKPPLLILLIWLYAYLSGASPSVLRASTMFTFIAIGQAYKRHVNIFNMVAASALVLLIINPLMIKSLGFQLSYVAVLGILMLYKRIYNLYSPSNYFIDKIWSLSAVSIAAQISTFPLSLLYFHQFPNLFLVSNLIVIPAAIMIVYTGVILLILSFSPFLSKILGFIVENIIYWLNEFIVVIDGIPFSTSKDIHFTAYACILTYLFIICLCIAIFHRKKHFLGIGLLFPLILIICFSIQKHHENGSNQILVYNIQNHSAIELKNGLKVYSILDSALMEKPQKINYYIKPNQTSYSLEELVHLNRKPDFDLYQFVGYSILLIGKDFIIPNKNISIDYTIISHQNRLYLKDLVEKVNANKYIFDTSNNRNQHYYWKKDCESLNLDCYFVSDSFAFEEKL